jgi:hypothetical protein
MRIALSLPPLRLRKMLDIAPVCAAVQKLHQN